MLKLLSLLLFLIVLQPDNLYAQQRGAVPTGTEGLHEYYIYISGVKTRGDVEKLENTIPLKSGVTYFMAFKRPALYYLLKSTTPVTQELFTSWIDSNLFKVEFYGEGLYNKEKAIVVGKKLRKIL